jgi:adenosylcobinamide hydrolase
MDVDGFETTRSDDVLQILRPQTRWLSTGVTGGYVSADAAYNITVPDGWNETELRSYADQRTAAAGFDTTGPALLTGVAQRHARYATCEPVTAVITAGVSNPATLPPRADLENVETETTKPGSNTNSTHPGTINIILVTTRSLEPAALATLLAGVAEAKAVTLYQQTGFSGTTSDAVIVGSDPSGEPAAFTGAATAVGRAARACVRDGLSAALAARYADTELPDSVADAEHGVTTTATATISTPE